MGTPTWIASASAYMDRTSNLKLPNGGLPAAAAASQRRPSKLSTWIDAASANVDRTSDTGLSKMQPGAAAAALGRASKLFQASEQPSQALSTLVSPTPPTTSITDDSVWRRNIEVAELT